MKRAAEAIYRLRVPLFSAAAAILIGNALIGTFVSADAGRVIRLPLTLAALVLAALCLVLGAFLPRFLPTSRERVVVSPVGGRWLGMNSPATKVPSHGMRAYGQAHAIDLVYEPVEGSRPEFGGPMMRPAREYPALGQPVFAMIGGTVARVSQSHRDHRARSNWWGFLYMMAEGTIRQIGGPGFVIGNHVTIRGDDGVYATIAHLQQDSATVGLGDRVTAGDRIGSCGNSGNSSEPHVHAQLMDRASFWTAQGVPMVFTGITLGEESAPVDGLPANEQHMTAPELSEARED